MLDCYNRGTGMNRFFFFRCQVFFISFLMLFQLAHGQYEEYKNFDFHPPLDTTLLLSGNFAELRPNHFHGGLDIKTGGQEGKNVYTIEDGYVSRIKISHGGYGKCLYITHPNGLTSVYAHLQKFNEEIQDFVRREQYARRTYQIELFPEKDQLTFKKGEVIAYSGNTGGSGGPHLHFEIRDDNQVPINPLLFNFNIKDNIAPKLTMLGIYPLDVNSYVNEKMEPIFLKPSKSDSSYYISNYKDLELSGKIGFGISVTDYLNNTSNRCGIFSIELKVDSVTYFKHTLEKVSFSNTRYINSLVDYSVWKKTGMKIQKCFLDPGNKLNTYSEVRNNGVYEVLDTLTHVVEILVKDSYMNISIVRFSFRGKKETSLIDPSVIEYNFRHDEYNAFQNDYIVLGLPEDALYTDINFEFSVDSSKNAYASPIYNVHNKYTPLHKPMTLSVIAKNIPKRLVSKAFVAEIDEGKPYYNAGSYNDDFITIKTKYFGMYAIVIDTVDPRVRAHNFVSNQNVASLGKMVFKVHDDLSGLASYQGRIDGKWVLLEYEYKDNELTYYFDDHLPKEGKHSFKLIVRDKVGNKTDYDIDFSL